MAVEAELVVLGGHVGVVGPVLVLGRAVIQVLGGEDKRGEEDAVGSTPDAASLGLQAGLEAVQVDKSRHKSRDLDVGRDDQLGDELLDGWQLLVVRETLLGLWGLGWCRRKLVLIPCREVVACDDALSSKSQIGDHIPANRLVDELFKGSLVELLHG